jgi:hypothetical protein
MASSALQSAPERRLSDKLLDAFDQACDQGEADIAREILALTERVINERRRTPDRRKAESLVAAYERLWQLRQSYRLAS